MPRAVIGLAVIAALMLAWWLGLPAQMVHWAQGMQREYQDALAGSLRSLRAGQPGAVATLVGLCFGYGFLHAVGPGHGKAVLGGYGAARPVPLRRMLVLAVASSLAQAGVAVALVYAIVLILNGARNRIEAFAGDVLSPLSWALVAGLGLWLIWRGVRGFRTAQAHEHHDHHHHHDESCGCGHRHGPTVDEVERIATVREGLALVAAIALRPCTGALFVLILTWQMGIGGWGVLGVFAMGVGTAAVTAATAALAVLARDGVVGSATGLGVPARVLHGAEIGMGLLIVAFALISMNISA